MPHLDYVHIDILLLNSHMHLKKPLLSCEEGMSGRLMQRISEGVCICLFKYTKSVYMSEWQQERA